MATLVRPSKNDKYYINPGYLTFVEDSGYGVQFIQVSASSSCYISVYDPENGIRYNDDSGLKKWKVTAYNNKFPDGDTDAWNIYVRLEREGTSALIVYDKKDRAVNGGVITITTDESGNEVKEVGEPDSTYFYIKIGTVGSTDGVSVIRRIIYDTGYLATEENRNAVGDLLASMFTPHYDNPANPEELTWIEAKSHLGINGGMTSFVDTGNPDLPKIYDGLPIDWETIYWEESENGKVLKAKGGGEGTLAGIEVTGEGNAITDVVPSSDGTKLIFSKSSTFVEKSYVDNGFYNKAYIEDHYYSKDSIDGTFPTKSYVDDTFATSADFNSLQSSFNDFLTGSDTDNIINKWKELEKFNCLSLKPILKK